MPTNADSEDLFTFHSHADQLRRIFLLFQDPCSIHPIGRMPERPSPNEGTGDLEEEDLIAILDEALDISDPSRARMPGTTTIHSTATTRTSSTSTRRSSPLLHEQSYVESQRRFTDAVHRSLVASAGRRAECLEPPLEQPRTNTNSNDDNDNDDNDDAAGDG